jgi:excinuclease ABC subunit A
MTIRLQGVRVHNLRDLSVEIPHGRLTVVTGVSGSGKSSLAFDTLYAEGQRRYVESLSTYARRFLERLDRPEVEHVEGIPPGVALGRRSPPTSARSTVGTVTEVHDYLRLLFARAGRLHCPGCDRPVLPESPGQVAARLVKEEAEARLLVSFPVRAAETVRAAGGEAFREGLRREGFTRLLRGARVFDLEDPAALRGKRPGVEVLVDRVVARPRARTRLSEAVDTAYRYGHGRAVVRRDDDPEGARRFSEGLHCPHCDRRFRPLRPNLFSFNNPLGACSECRGFGRIIDLDPGKIVPDPGIALRDGAIEPFTKPSYRGCQRDLLRFARRAGLPLDRPWRSLTERQRRLVWEGSGDWYGVRGLFDWLEARAYKVHVRVFLARYRAYVPCEACEGTRLVPEARCVRLGGESIDRTARRTVKEARRWLSGLKLERGARRACRPALAELERRLEVLDEVGLAYLTLDRHSRTLSGGEWQRVNLAACLGAGLTGTLYVLDEPTVGLHPDDAERLLGVLLRLRDLGNTVVVVEHDLETIRAADHVLDLGPGAGSRGGRLVARGSPRKVARARTPTGKALREAPAELGAGEEPEGPWLVLRGASAHNLRQVDLRLPLGSLSCVTGVSGSGKSSLVVDTLAPALERALGGSPSEIGPHDSLEGTERLEGVEVVDQSPIGRTPRSNPVTYVKAFDAIRKLYASQPAARAQRLRPGHFSFNVPGGRCEACSGAGSVTQEMHFLADVELTCEACGGRRFGPRVLEVRWRGMSIADLLERTVAEVSGLLAEAAPAAAARLRVLEETGLGYLRLGQPATTLSGGEAQRLKLSKALSRRSRGARLYLMDEPTVGLHPRDVDLLLGCLRRLVERGDTVLLVEHDRRVLAACDWIVDLGPGAAEEGGRVVACGSPAAVARVPESRTGRALARLSRRSSGRA